jgi:glycosyltransferase involved in cell wall biosynthesis
VHTAYTVHRFWPAVGGTELALMDLTTEIKKLGHDVTVITSDEQGSPAVEVRNGIEIRRFELERRGKFRFPPKSYRDLVIGGPWDIVHVKGQRVWSSDHLFKHVPKIRQPKVFTAHGFHQWHMHRRDPLELWYYRWHLPRALRPFDIVIALTQGEVEELVMFGVPREKIVILPDGVNLHEYETPPRRDFRERFRIGEHADADKARPGGRAGFGVKKKHMLLYAGGFYDNKRVGFLVRAVAQMKSDVELVVVGKDGHGLQGDTERLARDLRAPVRFLGVLPREDLVKAFHEADLFLLGSKFEGYGIVLLETLAAGVPFVSTPCGAAPDLAALGAGRVATTPEDMARVADELLADPALRAQMAIVGRKRARAQTLAWAAKEHEKLYGALLAGEKLTAPVLP